MAATSGMHKFFSFGVGYVKLLKTLITSFRRAFQLVTDWTYRKQYLKWFCWLSYCRPISVYVLTTGDRFTQHNWKKPSYTCRNVVHDNPTLLNSVACVSPVDDSRCHASINRRSVRTASPCDAYNPMFTTLSLYCPSCVYRPIFCCRLTAHLYIHLMALPRFCPKSNLRFKWLHFVEAS